MSSSASHFLRLLTASVAISATHGALAAVNFVGTPSPAANGDFNNDGVVDSADYTVWRDNDGGSTALPNDNGLGTPIGGGHYSLWSGNYGAVGGTGSTLAFENPLNWDPSNFDPVPVAGVESTPPGRDSIWFIDGNSEDITVVLTDERTGENGTEQMGTFAFGGESGTDDFNAKTTVIFNNSVTLTAIERNSSGEPTGTVSGTRPIRLGRENINPIGTLAGGTTETAPWAILKQTHGTLQYVPEVPANNATIDFSRDKPNSAGALYEISGDAVLNLHGAIRLGDRDNGGSRTTPGAIFRTRGSDATVNVEDYWNESRLGLWDHDNDITSDNPLGVTRMNLGKFVTEFVLDANGASTVVVNDELRLGRSEDLEGNREFGYAFLRIKLSEPTTAGSGAVGSGDEIVLFQADRITSAIDVDNDPQVESGEIEAGRFFDPDRAGFNSGGTAMLPHAGLWEGSKVRADYAGAAYEWTINYFDSDDDSIVVDAVTLSDLVVTGTPGDLSGNGVLGAEDRSLLVSMIASPPSIAIATAQNLFDLNADDAVDAMDLAAFDANFGMPAVAVPEPGALALLLLAGAAIAACRR
ncbi:hypothetical protein Pla108_18090 [Botrimarina colliarenosi]|uniref:PEP-CTERM protein-sorting domain-containing protein n=1 Tax=Botrimarina colliarenosi TaxID=2528001 RepID=A0A5C6AE22_9BACT|nr:PEP-CTERM sorting domain-containing protein [Botrimarina colliarenosi]TWT97657.1 hypothetical protein Pla108_18090 [Botrimarina colliarenosi]